MLAQFMSKLIAHGAKPAVRRIEVQFAARHEWQKRQSLGGGFRHRLDLGHDRDDKLPIGRRLARKFLGRVERLAGALGWLQLDLITAFPSLPRGDRPGRQNELKWQIAL